MLLKEEMWRVMCCLEWQVNWWRTHITSWDDLDDEVSDGLCAYAQWQAEVYRSIMLAFQMKWDEKLVRNARDATEVDMNLGETFIA